MTMLVWDKSGERRYEAGVDRGVLFPRGQAGVPWNGLISVDESPVGGDTSEYYLDGIKYLGQSSADEFAAQIQAYTYPDEFAVCDGTATHARGFQVTNQTRKPFNLAYRTRVGNDISGMDHGYKVHLIYNALVSPATRNYQSFSDTPEAMAFSWNITTTPVSFPGFRPTSHVIFDSTKITPEALLVVENLIYGSETTTAAFPQPAELISTIETTLGLSVTVDENGVFTVTGSDSAVYMTSPTTFGLSANNVNLIDADTYVITDSS